jgi:hypothetical protein
VFELDGLVVETDGARWPHDGHLWTDAATMARWGYELYGGFVLSDASLGEMLDFAGEWSLRRAPIPGIRSGSGLTNGCPFALPAQLEPHRLTGRRG